MTRQLTDFSFKAENELLERFEEFEKCSHYQTAESTNTLQAILDDVLKNCPEIEQCNNGDTDPLRGQFAEVEERLSGWLQLVSSDSTEPVSDEILLDKASRLAAQLGIRHFCPTSDWLNAWKQKNNIFKTVVEHEENKQDADLPDAENWLKNFLENELSKHDANNIYALNETGLNYYRTHPCTSFNGKENTARTIIKREFYTVLFACNMTGTDKKRPLVISNESNTRRSRGAKNSPPANCSASVSERYTTFLTEWDTQIKPKKILLILSNYVGVDPKVNLEHIELKILPNFSSIVHPFSRGFLRNVKDRYRKVIQNQFSNAVGSGNSPANHTVQEIPLSVVENVLADVWNNFPSKHILNRFQTAGFIKTQLEVDNADIQVDLERRISTARELPAFTDDDSVVDNNSNDDVTAPSIDETRIILDKLKQAVLCYGDADSYKFFFQLQVCTYMYIVHETLIK